MEGERVREAVSINVTKELLRTAKSSVTFYTDLTRVILQLEGN
jgi:hypothetical protein